MTFAQPLDYSPVMKALSLGYRMNWQLLAAIALFVAGKAVLASDFSYVKSQTCRACHEAQYDSWQDSHHAWSMRPATTDNVLGDFNNAAFSTPNQKAIFTRTANTFQVAITENDASSRTFEILYTVGVTPLQQYIVQTEPGKLQTLNFAWDTDSKKWFHLQPEIQPEQGDGLHWTGAYQNWNSRCADCHSTAFKKGYDQQNQRYFSSWVEDNIGCEACHGPGSNHVKLAKTDPSGQSLRETPQAGFPGTPTASNALQTEQCASCHSRRESLTPASHNITKSFDTSFNLALLRDGLYFPDGQIRDEVFVYGSFLQSKMHQSGVTCLDCHKPHSLKLKAEGDKLCLTCHSQTPNEKFPTASGLYDDPEHHRHKLGSEGAGCVSCHMTARTYMVVDPRRDHSFRVPRPDLSVKTESPNACTGCHKKLTNQEAQNKIETWYPEGRWKSLHFGAVFHAADGTNPKAQEQLAEIVSDPAHAAIVRASALDRLRSTNPETAAAIARHYLADQDPFLRRTSVRALRGLAKIEQAKLLTPLLTDPSKAVRLELAPLLLSGANRHLAPNAAQAAADVIREYTTFLGAMTDMPETHLKIARLAAEVGNQSASIAALEKALELDNNLVEAWLALGSTHVAGNRLEQAEQVFKAGLAREPENISLLHHLGVLYIDANRVDEAVKTLERALALDPDREEVKISLVEAINRRTDPD